MRETRIPRQLEAEIYLNNYFIMYKRLTRSCIRVELATPAYLGLGTILPINFYRAPVYAWNSHWPHTCG